MEKTELTDYESNKKHKKKRFKATKIVGILLGIVIILMISAVMMLKYKFGKTYPEFTENAQIGEWYSVSPEEAKSSDGSDWHGLIRLGKENKVLVFFYGGGVSLNEETSKSDEWYFIPTVMAQDLFVENGIFSTKECNPFKDWTFLAIEYSTGDFHCGQNELHFQDENGKEKTIYHNGYNNYDAFMKTVLPYVKNAEALVVTGSSAGGFATALLTDDVCSRFSNVKNVTACVDSALLYYDSWKETAANIWNAPAKIQAKIQGDNIVLDNLIHLQNTYGDRVKILFTCSVRDKDLQRYQAYINYGKLEETKENSELFQKDLKRMVTDMEQKLPNSGVYIWEYGENATTNSTQHMIMPSNVFDKLSGDYSVADWLYDAVNGEIHSYGVDLLDNCSY